MTVTMLKSVYHIESGNFVFQKPGGPVVVETCRDRFHVVSEAADFFEFFLCHAPDRSPNVIRFMRMVEIVAGVHPQDALTLRPTDDPQFTHVRMTPWWKQRVRRSLLTALVRCGQHFVQDTGAGFTAALYHEYYTKDTRVAIERFLAGFCAVKMKKSASFGGWWHLFVESGYDPTKILVRAKRRTANADQPQAAGHAA